MAGKAAGARGQDSSPTGAVIVAHPDDETLWAGGLILSRPDFDWYIACLCRQSDPDRSPRFSAVLQRYGARGAMADLDDGPQQLPLAPDLVEKEVLHILPAHSFDLIVTHAPRGEYTRHRRHEEVSRAVLNLWEKGLLRSPDVYLFAYEDGGGKHLPRAIPSAHHVLQLPAELQAEKQHLITQVYGFAPVSWEARTTPRTEAFWCFDSHDGYRSWLREQGVQG